MKTIILSFLGLLLFNNGYGQSQDIKSQNISFYISPFSLIYTEPRLIVGIEQNFRNRTALALSLGYGNPFKPDGNEPNNYQYYEIKPEFKYYLDWFIFPAYISSQLYVSHLNETMYNSYFDISDSRIDYSKADFTKRKIGLSIIGSLKPYLIKDKVYIEFFGGLGVMHRKTAFENVKKSNTRNESFIFDFNMLGRKDHESTILPDVIIGFKIGYEFKR